MFDVVPANLDAETLGAAHYQEVTYVFGNTRANGWVNDPFPKEPAQRQRHVKLAEIMSSMWISFAVTHSSNFHQVPECGAVWPVYNKDSPVNMVFTAEEGCLLQSDTWRTRAIEMVSEMALDARSHLG